MQNVLNHFHVSSVYVGVAIVPILKRSGQEDCLILIKQFRAPMKSFVIEFPAGKDAFSTHV